MATQTTMKRRLFIVCVSMLFALFFLASPKNVAAQQEKEQRTELRLSHPEVPKTSPAESLEPSAELEREIARKASFTLRFRRTKLDTEAEAIAQVAVRNQTLLVRVIAKNLPLPAHWKEARYSLWVDLPNYQQRMYIGDLPITPVLGLEQGFYKSIYKSIAKRDGINRGISDTTFRFAALPRGAVFGGLIITAEPARFDPIINEPLRPLLIALTSDESIESAPPSPPPARRPPAIDRERRNDEEKSAPTRKSDKPPTLKVKPNSSIPPRSVASTKASSTATDAPSSAARGTTPPSEAPGSTLRGNAAKDKQVVYVGSLLSKATQKVVPVYPSSARDAGTTGIVSVYLEVDATGTVAMVEPTSGPPALRQAAAEAARRWRFQPTVVNGRIVRMTGFINFTFRL